MALLPEASGKVLGSSGAECLESASLDVQQCLTALRESSSMSPMTVFYVETQSILFFFFHHFKTCAEFSRDETINQRRGSRFCSACCKALPTISESGIIKGTAVPQCVSLGSVSIIAIAFMIILCAYRNMPLVLTLNAQIKKKSL